MVTNTSLPFLLINKGVVNAKIAPVVPVQKVSKYNKNNRRPDEQKKRNVQTTAAILRVPKQGQD
jgi:hypothetical protein